MAKDSRFQYEYRKNASRLHKAVGEILRNDPLFTHYTAYQEYPVNKVNESYPHGSHHFDWVIPQLFVVIECHGRQHFQAVAFDGDVDKAVESFHATRYRDNLKKNAALAAGYRYVVIPYTFEKTVTSKIIADKINEAEKDLETYRQEHAEEIRKKEEAKANALAAKALAEKRQLEREARERYLASQAHQDSLKKAREFRQKRYRRLKELKDGS